MHPVTKTANPREAAFLAAWSSHQEHCFVSEALDLWQKAQNPSAVNAGLARQIAFGTVQMSMTLDHLAIQLTEHRSLKIKTKERLLLRSALYQAHFMDRLPLYSVVNESVEIARRHFHGYFAKFLNGLLRSYATKQPLPPAESDAESLSVRCSYPLLYVEQLLRHYGLHKAQEVLALGNAPAQLMVRVRQQASPPPDATAVFHDGLQVVRLHNPSDLARITESSHYYTQNVTPVFLMACLAKETAPPRCILDLCAAPGGKALAAKDLFPNAELVVNDTSELRLHLLKENFAKYGVHATVTCEAGETYPQDKKFDLIILDVPCSNSGVFNKRPEARWRLTQPALQQLATLQASLVERAASLLSPSGAIWYLTCSILPEENEALIKDMCQRFTLHHGTMHSVLPTRDGWDGGFGCLLKR